MLLDNGILFSEKYRPFTNTLTASIRLKGGLFAENQENNGIGTLFCNTLLRSSKILENSEFYGFDVFVKMGIPSIEIGFSAPVYMVEKALDEFEAFISLAELSQDKFDLEKSLLLSDLKTSLDNPDYILSRGFRTIAMKGTPYSLGTFGTEESVKKITFEDIKKYRDTVLKSLGGVAVLVGNYDNKVKERFLKIASSVEKGVCPLQTVNKPVFTQDVWHEDTFARIKQTKLILSYDAPDVHSKEYASLNVLAEFLGGGMSSRYFNTIRKDLGFSYATWAMYVARQRCSYFAARADLDYDNAKEAVDAICEINENLSKTFDDREFEKAKKSLLGSSLIATQTNSAIAGDMGRYSLLGLGADFREKFIAQVENLTADEFLRSAELFNGNKIVYILKPE